MPKVTFIEHDGQQHTIDAPANVSLMQAAADNSVPGIMADCGGNCSCATCHVYVEHVWLSKIEPPSGQEREMIECALDVKSNSRLSCQIPLSPELDGLIVRLPASQI